MAQSAQTRQKLLVGALVVIFAGYALDQLYQYGYEGPLLLAERQKTQLEQTLRKNKIEIRQKQSRLDALQAVQQRSLPRNLELGISAYRNWLLKVLGESGLEQANLDLVLAQCLLELRLLTLGQQQWPLIAVLVKLIECIAGKNDDERADQELLSCLC